MINLFKDKDNNKNKTFDDLTQEKFKHWDALKLDIINLIKKKQPSMSPAETMAFTSYLLTSLVYATVEVSHEADPTKIDRKEAGLRMCNVLCESMRHSLLYNFEMDKLR